MKKILITILFVSISLITNGQITGSAHRSFDPQPKGEFTNFIRRYVIDNRKTADGVYAIRLKIEFTLNDKDEIVEVKIVDNQNITNKAKIAFNGLLEACKKFPKPFSDNNQLPEIEKDKTFTFIYTLTLIVE